MTADPRPVWLLDVDGVLNADKPGWGGAPTRRHVWSSHIGRQFPIRFAPALLERIRRIHRAGRVEIRWCTTWCGDTAVLERALVLPRLAEAWADYRNGYSGAAAKLEAARAVLAEGRRLIWTDDTEVPRESTPLHDELSAGGRSLLIRPDGRIGLQPGHLDLIEAFIAQSAPVAVGQVWVSLDKRSNGRTVRVESVTRRFARVVPVGKGIRSRVSIMPAPDGGSRLRGYRLIGGEA